SAFTACMVLPQLQHSASTASAFCFYSLHGASTASAWCFHSFSMVLPQLQHDASQLQHSAFTACMVLHNFSIVLLQLAWCFYSFSMMFYKPSTDRQHYVNGASTEHAKMMKKFKVMFHVKHFRNDS
ncbi:MAG: hypothetical protein ABIG42_02490, partial [bacterium]